MMDTRIFKIESANDLPDIKAAADILKSGGLLAIPTETVYGLGASMACPAAIRHIFEVKGRPQDNPLILHISGTDKISRCAANIPQKAYELAEKFWPGPLTMILPKAPDIPDEVTAGLDTVGVRCPANEVTRAIIRECGEPVAAPSANLSGKPSTTNAGHVIHDLFGRIEGIVDGGECAVGLESTIIDLTVQPPRLLRPGGITHAQLKSVLGEVDIDPAVRRALKEGEKPKAPGMKYRHYAPAAPITILRGSAEKAAEYVSAQGLAKKAVLCFDEEKEVFAKCGAQVYTYGRREAPGELAHRLFARLRDLDETDTDQIFARCPEGDGVEMAIKNRLSKAAGYSFIDL